MKLLGKLIKKNNNKGFTIAEVIIAMAVIVVVSVSTTTILTRARNVSTTTYYYSEARNITENALECFKYSETESEFFYATRNLEQKLTKTNDVYVYGNLIYELQITVTYSQSDNRKDSFAAICYNANGKQLFKCNYERS